MSLYLDHTVINVIYEMDAAAPAFEALGFTLTPRGHHSMGSMNHLMMFGDDYLELIGLPRGMEMPRADIAEAPYGINGLVFKSDDVDRTFARLKTLDMDGDPPRAFNRPVKLADGEHPAEFRTVAVRPGTFPAGRVYFCEHGTPELVWRPEWQDHKNKVQRMAEVVVVAKDAAAQADGFARLIDTPAKGTGDEFSVALTNSKITVLSPGAYRMRYRDMANDLGGRPSLFGALVFETADLEAAQACIEAAGVPAETRNGGLAARIEAFDSLLEFRPAE